MTTRSTVSARALAAATTAAASTRPNAPHLRCVACMRSSHPTIFHGSVWPEIAPYHADNQGAAARPSPRECAPEGCLGGAIAPLSVQSCSRAEPAACAASGTQATAAAIRARGKRNAARHPRARARSLSQVVRALGTHPLSQPQLPFAVAGGPAHVLRLRDGDADPRLVRADRDRLRHAADTVRRHAVRGHAGVADLRRHGRQDRPSQPALRHARRLYRAGFDTRGRRAGGSSDADPRVR